MLRRSSTSKKDAHVVWDEENLRENEEIQKQYSSVRIAEPKTPYRPPLPSDSLDDDLGPLQLDEDAIAAAVNSRREGLTAFDYVMSKGGAEFQPSRAGSSSRAAAPAAAEAVAPAEPPAAAAAAAAPAAAPAAGSHASSEHDDHDGDRMSLDGVGDKRQEPCTSGFSSGSEGGEKRRKFEQMRKQHYNMRDALVQARVLLASEDEDAVEAQRDGGGGDEEHADREGDEDDTAGWHASNGASAGAAGQQQQQQQQQQQRRRQPAAGDDVQQQAADGGGGGSSSGAAAANGMGAS